MGGAWKTDQGEPLAQDLKGLVEIVIEGPMTREEVLAFDQALRQFLQNHGTFQDIKRRIKLKKEIVL